MATPISPGVYSKITDLSSYVQAIPGTISFLCSLVKKGEDNVLKFYGSRSEYVAECGEPNINEYGKNYGQGPYLSYNALGEAGSFYHMRCMPDDAAFSNMRIIATQAATDASATISVTFIDSADANTHNELITKLATSGDDSPICVLRAIGRGEHYNGLGIRFTEHANPLLLDTFVMDIYEKQSDGSEVIIESFDVSFEPRAVDSAGDSLWIVSVLENFSSVLRAHMELASEAMSPGYELVSKIYDKEIGETTMVNPALSGVAELTDNKQDFSDWETAAATYEYCIELVDQRGNKLYGWLGAASGTDNETIAIFNERTSTQSPTQDWNDISENDTVIATFDYSNELTYRIKKSFTSIASAFASSTPVPLKKGSDGALLQADGSLDTTVATTTLQNGYNGSLNSPVDGSSQVDDVLDSENVYFSLVFDAGYPSDVKTAISTLVQTRRDCLAICDNGDNSSYSASITKRTNTHTFNTYLVSLFEEFNKIRDPFTGQDIWVSPTYHMSYLIPRNDNVGEIWTAAAGFNRASIDTIKELRFNPSLGQRDQMYLKQLNPIVKFNPGYTVWGQLTSQAKASALQDINITRLVLYVKRALEEFCRYFIFELNDSMTWDAVSQDINEFLEDIKKRRGLYSFNIDVGATEYELKRKTFHVNVTLEPTRVVEKIELNFFIE
jgi:hypothetical protein